MKVVTDDPGQRLCLEQVKPAPCVPPMRVVRALTLDRLAGAAVLKESSLWGLLPRQRSLPLSEIRGIRLESYPRGRWREGVRPVLQLTLTEAAGPGWQVTIWIDDMDLREELLDLAFRIAAIAGLAGYRVIRNDPVGFGVDLAREAAAGMDPVPAVKRTAGYARDRVEGEIEVPEVEIPPFDPDEFDSAYVVERWEPGREVVLRRPFGWQALGCVVLLLSMFGGITAMFLLGAVQAVGPERYIFAFIGLVGAVAVIGGLTSALRKSMPRRATVDWGARVIRVRGLLGGTEMPFDGVREIEVRGDKHVRPSGRGSTGGVFYCCQIVVHGTPRGETGVRELVLTETLTTKGDPTSPVRGARPLGVELADSLGVPHRYTDYS